MGVLTGTLRATWEPAKTNETATKTYWSNWRVFLCAIWVLISMFFASYLISRHEGPRHSTSTTMSGNSNSNSNSTSPPSRKEKPGVLYEDEVWMPCFKGVHPGWLLGFRVFAFFVLLILLIVNVIYDGGSIFYYYTQWTFTLVTIYFGLGSVLSMYGCYDYHQKISGDRVHDHHGIDAERGGYIPSSNNGTPMADKSSFSSHLILDHPRHIAGFWGYVFQVIFQMNAGAVMLTDTVFWFIIVPFLSNTTNNYDLNFFIINMHTINLVFLLGDTTLNCLRFPWFRIAYFFLWTSFFVIFQWVLHACISIWWPYPFLDLSSSFAPLWYASVAIMHFPCYGLFILIIRLKHILLSRCFPQSYKYAK